MYFGVLGPLQLRTDDRAVVLTGVPAKLLVALIARQGKVVESRDLVALLPKGGRDTLRSHIRKIKSVLQALPEIDGAPVAELVNQRGIGYSLRIARGATDVDRFTELIDQGLEWSTRGDHVRAVEALTEALSLWRDMPMPEVASWALATDAVRKLIVKRERARIARVEAEFALGGDDQVITEARLLTKQRPTRPELWRMWAVSVYRTEDAATASEICAQGLRTLREHGIGTTQLERVQEQILRDDPALQERPPERARGGVFGEPPPLTEDFAGRQDDLAVIREALYPLASGSAPAAVVLHGASGIGKSTLALKHWHETRGPDDVLIWVPAGSPVTARTAIARSARRLGVHASVPDDDVAEELWRLLAARGRWTLVFDDAPDAAAVAPHWPTAGNGKVIVTTTAARWDAPLHTHRVLPLTERDARHLLGRFATEHDQHVVAELARRLGGVPIALQAALSSLRSGSDASSFLASLRGPEQIGASQTWRPVLDGLRAESPAAAEMACFLAFLDNAPIPVDLVRNCRALFPASLSAALRTATGTDEVFAVLGRRLSISTTPDSVTGMHALVKAVVVADLRERSEYDTWLRTTIRVFEAILEEQDRDQVSPEVLYPHVLAVTVAARAANAELAATIRLLLFAADHAGAAGEMLISARAYTDALAVEERRSGRESEEVATIQMTLGMVLRNQSELGAAQQMFERALRIRESRTGPKSAPVCEALAAIGIVLFDHGRFHEACAILDRSIAAQDALPDVSPVLRRQTLSVYGLVLWRLNELTRADAVASEVLSLAKRQFGDDHPVFATALDNLGKVVFAQGKLDRALALNRRALEIRRTALGARHPFTALSEYHLARVLRRRGTKDELLEARQLCVHALDVYRQRLGADHSHVARCQAELGLTDLALGHHRTAVDTLTDAHGVALRSLGVDHYETALCLGDLAHALFASGQPDHAAACAEDALGTLRRSGEFDDRHPYVTELCELARAARAR